MEKRGVIEKILNAGFLPKLEKVRELIDGLDRDERTPAPCSSYI